jgi:hypothetical protein
MVLLSCRVPGDVDADDQRAGLIQSNVERWSSLCAGGGYAGSSRKCSYTISLSSCGNSRNGNGFLLWYCILRYLLRATRDSRGSKSASRVTQPLSSKPARAYSERPACHRDNALAFVNVDAMTTLVVTCGVPFDRVCNTR